MKKTILALAVAMTTGQAHAACVSRTDMRGTWDYYQAVAYAAA